MSARSSPELTLDFTCAGGKDCKLASAAAATDRAVAAERVMIPFEALLLASRNLLALSSLNYQGLWSDVGWVCEA